MSANPNLKLNVVNDSGTQLFFINQTTGTFINNISNFNNTTVSTGLNSASTIFLGGVNINCTSNSINTSIGGAMSIAGGLSVAKDALINRISCGSIGVIGLTAGNIYSSTLNSNLINSTSINSTSINTTSINISGNVTIGGNLLVLGQTTIINLTTANQIETNVTSSNIFLLGNLIAGFNSHTLGNIFTTGGNVGINTINPLVTLDVNGSANFNRVSSGNLFSTNITTSTLQASNGITVGNINFTGDLYQNGLAYLGSQWTTTSGNLSYTTGNVVLNGSLLTNNLTSNFSTISNSIFTNISSSNIIANNINGTNITFNNLLGTNTTFSNVLSTSATIPNIINTNISSSTMNLTTGLTTNSLFVSNTLNASFNSNTLGNLFTNGTNVGIGTKTPIHRLDVFNGRINVRNNTGSAVYQLQYESSAVTQGTFCFGSSDFKSYIYNENVLGGTNNSLILQATEINSQRGFVGIGTNVPAFKLDVNGDARIVNGLTTSTLTATSSSITNMNSTNVTTTNMNVTNISSNTSTITNAISTNISTNNILATTFSTSNLYSSLSTIGNLVSLNFSSSNLISTTATVSNIINTNITSNNVFITAGSLVSTFNSNTLGNIFTTGGNVGINTTSPFSQLDIISTSTFGNVYLGQNIQNRKIVLYNVGTNDNQFFGFGINSNAMRYQINTIQDSHVFYAGINSTSSNELFRIQGTGNVIVAGTMNSVSISSGNIFSANISVGSILSTNINTSNISSTNLNTTNITSTNLNTSNITSTNIISPNITSSNILCSTLFTSNLTSTNIIVTNNTLTNLNSTFVTTSSLLASQIDIKGVLNVFTTAKTLFGGIGSELNSIINFGINDTRFGSPSTIGTQGGFYRVDTRSFQNPIQIVINTTSGTPFTPFQISVSGNTLLNYISNQRTLQIGNAGTASQGNISVVGAGQARYHLFNGGGVMEWVFGQKSSSSHSFTISALNSNNENDVFTIQPNGNIGIGTTTPSFKLDINGNSRIQNTAFSINSTTGSLVSLGGVSITGTNASSNTNGGALTVNGGIGVLGDSYIGGNVFIQGINSSLLTGNVLIGSISTTGVYQVSITLSRTMGNTNYKIMGSLSSISSHTAVFSVSFCNLTTTSFNANIMRLDALGAGHNISDLTLSYVIYP